MPAVIPWAENELQTLATDPHSRIFSDQRKITVVLQPFHLQDLKTAVRDLLNAGVNCYDKSLDGILLGYDKLKVLSKSASVSAETSGVAIEIQANFYTFRPEIGSVLKGVVNKISNDHVGILVYQRFNVSCPRPGADAKSAKWIGNSVVMHQEVMFKLKEKNFSGRLPFFKGKIMEIGNVVCEQDKKSKKKLKETVPDESILSETSSQITKKSRKHKLDESVETQEVKTKKTKNLVESSKRPVERDADDSIALTELTSPKLKKKKLSIGSLGETDFIPRLSLDVSQLPEDLPPPNADSTHFDLTKNLSISIKGDKKKKKMNDPDLTAIREESADGSKVNSRLTDKSQQLHEEKTKKKMKNLNQDSSAAEGAPPVKTPKKKSSKEEKQADLDLPPPKSPKKKQAEAASKTLDTAPVKDKKSKIDKNVNASSQFNAELNDDINAQNLLSPTKAKKKCKEDKLESSAVTEKKKAKEDKVNSSPTKEKKKSKDKLDSSPSKEKLKEIASSSLDPSDDYIPPGQKSFKASPKKRSGDSSWKEESLSVSIANSPGIEYFAASRSMMDAELGSRRSGRQVPLMYGSLEGKIPPPPESPIKSSFSPNMESDSDSNPAPPKKLVISTKSQDSSDSYDSESDQDAAKSKPSHKPREDDSDDSDSDTAAKNKLLVSMGVMQSPLKTAKPIVKPDTSESESEESFSESKSLKGGVQNKNDSYTKSQKPILAAESKSKLDASRSLSPKKALKTNPASKNPSSSNLNQDSDSDDELETMKAALLKIEENKHSKVKTNKSKPPKLNSDDVAASTKKTEKKPMAKTVSQNSSKVNSVLSKLGEDSDSDTELIQSVSLKVSSLPKATQGKKSKLEKPDVPSKKTKAAPAKKTKTKANISSISQTTSKDNPGVDDSDDDEAMRAAIHDVVNKKSEIPTKKAKAPSVKKTKQKPDDSKVKLEIEDSDDDEAIRAAIQNVVNNKSENLDAPSKKTKAAPAKKTKTKANILSVSQATSGNSKKTGVDDSDDDEEAMRAAIQNVINKKPEKTEVPAKKAKAPVKKTKQKPDDSKVKLEIKDSDDDDEAIRAAIQNVVNNKSENLDAPSKKAKAAPVKKSKQKSTASTSNPQETSEDFKNKPEIDDSDDEVMRNVMQKLKENHVLGKTVPQAKEKQKRGKAKAGKDSSPSKKLVEKSHPFSPEKSNVKNCSSISYDSDSGPDDKNTTDTMEEMRQQRTAGGTKKAAKSVKSQKASVGVKSETKKGKSSKADTSSKITVEQHSISEKKQKPKGKKKASADEEISDVMQRLLRQAKLSVGL